MVLVVVDDDDDDVARVFVIDLVVVVLALFWFLSVKDRNLQRIIQHDWGLGTRQTESYSVASSIQHV